MTCGSDRVPLIRPTLCKKGRDKMNNQLMTIVLFLAAIALGLYIYASM